MKKAALYSKSTRSRTTDGPAPGSEAAGAGSRVPEPPGRIRRFATRHERALLFTVMGGFAVALVATQFAQRTPPRAITQQDIDAAVLHTLENTQLPSIYAKAVEAVAPSVVRVVGLGPERSDDDKDKDPGKPSDAEKGKDSGKNAGKDSGKSAGNDGGRGSAKDVGKDKDAAKGKGNEDKRAEPGKDGSKESGKDGKPERRGSGVGTGVVIVDKGIILTNLHVVIGAETIRVRFFDGFESEATVIGMRPEHDLAVLQAKSIPDDLQAAALRSTADLAIGDHVVAVGFPFGIGPSASAGVVSGLRREYHSPEGKRLLTNLIQFDAAANPGNSGGPLVTVDGEVVGIVTGILNPTEQRVFIGIGFAVPIENAAAAVGISPF